MYADLFNEVLGPIMAGPSSSHTAGRRGWGTWCTIYAAASHSTHASTFSASGSYASSYQGQGADRGFAAGLLGFEPDDARVYDALSLAPQMGMDLQFSIVDEPYPHSNSALIACTPGRWYTFARLHRVHRRRRHRCATDRRPAGPAVRRGIRAGALGRYKRAGPSRPPNFGAPTFRQ